MPDPLATLSMHRTARPLLPAISLLVMLFGCASTPDAASSRASDATARKAVAHAQELIGTPYRYGGATPEGFDCSGLVNYTYARSGVTLPRSTELLRKSTALISMDNLREGDLLFFNQEDKKASHVALYLGNGRFIHAPSTGGKVRTDLLTADYWKKHFAEARRI
ncbi:MAG: C40 family peptidase [Burkholderiales bacterium]